MKLSKQEQEWVKELKTADEAMDKIRKDRAKAKPKHMKGCTAKGTCVFESEFFGNGFHLDEATTLAKAEGMGVTDAQVKLSFDVAAKLGQNISRDLKVAVEELQAAGIEDKKIAGSLAGMFDQIAKVTKEGAAMKAMDGLSELKELFDDMPKELKDKLDKLLEDNNDTR